MVVLDKTDVRSVCFTFRVVNKGVISLAQNVKESLKIRLRTKIQVVVVLSYRSKELLNALLSIKIQIVMSLW